jgi:hypothetical protein
MQLRTKRSQSGDYCATLQWYRTVAVADTTVLPSVDRWLLDLGVALIRTDSALPKLQTTAMNFINKISGALDDATDSARSAVLKLLEPEVRHRMLGSVTFLQCRCTIDACIY